MSKNKEEKLPPRRYLDSAFYQQVRPDKWIAPMQKDIKVSFYDQDNRGYEPYQGKNETWDAQVESVMKGYDSATHQFCWVVPNKDHQMPAIGYTIDNYNFIVVEADQLGRGIGYGCRGRSRR